MRHVVGAGAAVLVLLSAATAAEASPADTLAEARRALGAAAYDHAADLAGPIARFPPPGTELPDRAEAWRILGIALYFLERTGEAERALLEFAKADPDAHLDPALVPPEAIVFFEDVRARHAAELKASRPKAPKKRYWAFSLLPPVGQFQNGDHIKGWIITGAGVVLIGTNLTAYFVGKSWCSNSDDTCSSGSSDPFDPAYRDRTSDAKLLRGINILSGVGIAGLYIYGVVDGFIGHARQNRIERARRWQLGMAPTPGGAQMQLELRF